MVRAMATGVQQLLRRAPRLGAAPTSVAHALVAPGVASAQVRHYRTEYSSSRVMNFSAGCAALPVEVLERAQKDFVNWQGRGLSVMEMGYRTSNFRQVMATAEETFRKLMGVPDDFEVHFFN